MEEVLERTETKTETPAEKPYMDRIRRLKKRVLDTKPEIDLEDAVLMTKGFQEAEGQPLVVKRAHAFYKQCAEKSVKIWDDELIVGNPGSKQRGGIVTVDDAWSVLDDELDTINERKYDPFYLRPEDKEVFIKVIRPYWKGKSIYEQWLAQCPKESGILRDCGALYINRKGVRGWGETTAGYTMVINEGMEGIKKRIQASRDKLEITHPGDYAKMVYLKALDICADGISLLGHRYAAEARRLADQTIDGKRKRELLDIAEACDRVPEKPARNFREAIQSMYLYQCCIFMEHNAASYNPGRMDQYLYPFYKKDVEEGKLTPDEAQELLDCLWVKFSEPCLFQDATTSRYSAGYPMFQNVTCGGIDERGRDAVNDVSYMILEATAEVQLYQPSLSVRFNMAKNPTKFLRKIAEVIKLGTGFPAFHNDMVGMEMLMNKGIPMSEAWNWNPCGCVETNLEGKQKCMTGYGDFNLGAVVEFTLLDGKSRKYNRQASVKTGDPRNFKDYAEFYDAVRKQIHYMIHWIVAASHVNDDISFQRVSPALSLSFPECIEKAKDYAWGGPKYTVGNGLDAIGVADLINSVYAVKYLVYDHKKITMDRLLEALDHNFEGYDDVKRMCDECPKYGNDDDEVNELASDLFTYIADEIESYSSRFGKMTPGILPVSGNTPFGMEVGALPSGRLAYTPLADGLSPNQGTDTQGMSATLRSVSNIPHARFDQGTLLNVKLDTTFRDSPNSTEQMMNFLRALCSLNVFHAQFNVIDTETLKDAQIHPENHKGLLVRVAGYTAYFTELGVETQNDIISRTNHSEIA